ncbi:MAG: ABC transporter permease [Roseiarcus sp.]|jgi:ABC-2 type transport system permease protein
MNTLRVPSLGATRAIRFFALVRKETLQVMRDPSSIMIAFVLPVILLFIFGYGVSLDAYSTRISLVDENPTQLSKDLAASFIHSRYFAVAVGSDRRQFEDALVAGATRGIVVIPATFTADFSAADSPSIQVIVDGADTNTANFVQNYAAGVVDAWAAGRRAEFGGSAPAIDVQQRVWFNAELASRNFLVPGSIAIVMTLIGTMLTSLVVAREWERGTMEAIMATPATAVELLASKVLPYFLLGMTSATLCLALAVWLFGVPFRGSVGAFYLLAASFLIPSLGQGMLISAATKNQFLASQSALISAFLPSFLLSGFLFEIDSMPTAIQWLTLIVPARYLIPSLQSVFLAGDVWPLFLQDIAAMLAIGSVFFLGAARTTRKRIA